ncbi:MAG: A24 family peptidase C-terminal domain-containing protein [Desulfurococcaceae archaeon]
MAIYMIVIPARHMYVINLIRVLYSLFFLIIFSIQDYKWREINDKLVYVFTAGSVVFFIVTLNYLIELLDPQVMLLYICFTIMISPLLTGIMYISGLMGKGDVYVTTSIGLLYTFPFTIVKPFNHGFDIMPPLLTIMIYSTTLIVIFSIVNCLYNCIRNVEHLKKIPLKYRIIYMFIAKPIRIRDYIRRKYYFPLEIIDIRNGILNVSWRININVEKEDLDVVVNKYKELCDRQIIDPDTYIWASYGIPFIIPLTVGLIIYILIGDAIIFNIINLNRL